jgi:hypothetical protein
MVRDDGFERESSIVVYGIERQDCPGVNRSENESDRKP